MPRGKRNPADEALNRAQAHLNSGPANGHAAEDATAGHNSYIRAEKIRDVCKRLKSLDDEIKSLQDDKAQIKNEIIKGQLNMKTSDFMMAYRLYQLENADRDELLDTLRETFKALGVGEQLDWLDQAHGKAPIPPAAPVHDPAAAAA